MTKVSARDRLSELSEGIIEKVIVKRGKDDIGIDDEWSEKRVDSCGDDWTYDLAVEIRKLRVNKAMAWWRIAQELELPGAGASAKQGRAGAAFARRVWRAAYGQTYSETNANRETKDEKTVRYAGESARSYFATDDPEMYIIGKLKGSHIEWVTKLPVPDGLVTSLQETYVHDDPRLIWVKEGPKGRYVEFYEQPDPELLRLNPTKAIAKGGPLRSVYLDRITKVGA